MIYKFKSKASGDVIMMGPTGDHLLGIIGKPAAPKGIVLPEDMPSAIAAIEKAIADDETDMETLRREAAAEGKKLPPREGVSLRQRAWPLVELFKRSAAAGVEVVWGV
jgi:hypothetical protein